MCGTCTVVVVGAMVSIKAKMSQKEREMEARGKNKTEGKGERGRATWHEQGRERKKGNGGFLAGLTRFKCQFIFTFGLSYLKFSFWP